MGGLWVTPQGNRLQFSVFIPTAPHPILVYSLSWGALHIAGAGDCAWGGHREPCFLSEGEQKWLLVVWGGD